jgi:hypothetical protein
MLEAVRGRPPPLAVIRGAVGGVWLVFEEVYEVKSKKCEKLLKKKVVKIFRTGILEVGLRPKKRSPNILAAPLSKFLNTPLAIRGKGRLKLSTAVCDN